MFRIFPSGNTIDMSHIKALAIDTVNASYRVMIYGIGDVEIEATRFNTEDKAKEYIKQLAAELNGFTNFKIVSEETKQIEEELPPLPESDGWIDTQDGVRFNIESVAALFVGGYNYDEVHAIFNDADILIKKFTIGSDSDRTENAGAYIDELSGYCPALVEVAKHSLYVAPHAVDYMAIDQNRDELIPFDIVVKIKVGSHFLCAEYFNSAKEAFVYKDNLNLKFDKAKKGVC